MGLGAGFGRRWALEPQRLTLQRVAGQLVPGNAKVAFSGIVLWAR